MKKSEVDRILGKEAGELSPAGAPIKEKDGFFSKVASTALEVLVGAPHKGTIKALEGMYDATAGLVGAVGGAFDSDFKDDVGKHIAFDATGWLSDAIGYDKVEEKSLLNNGKVGNFIRDAETAIGGMAPSVALSAIPYAGAVLGPVSMGLSSGGNAMEEALNKGAGYYGSWAYGIGSGVVESATEMIGGFALGKGGTAAKKILAGTKLGKFASKPIGKLAEGFVSEGFEEVLSDVASPALQYVTGVDKNIGENYKETAKNLPRTFLLGGTVGTIMGGGSAAVSGVRNSSRGGFKASRADNAMAYIADVSKNYGTDVNKNAKYDKAINGALMDISKELTSMNESQRKEYLKTMGVYKNAFNSEDGSIKAELRANINEDAVSSHLRAISATLKYAPIGRDVELSESAGKAKSYVEKMLGERASVVVTSDKAQNNAFYNKNEGIIYINNNAAFSGEEIAEFVATHEVAHITEGTVDYAKMAILLDEIAKEPNAPAALKAKIGDVKARREQIRKAYAGQMENMNFYQREYLVDTEYTADLVGLLLGDEYFIEKLANRNLPLVEKIFKGLKNLNKKSAAVDKASAKYLNKLVNKFGKAIDNAKGGVSIKSLGGTDEEQAEQGEVDEERKSLTKSKIERLKNIIFDIGNLRIRKNADGKIITVLTDDFTVNKAIFSKKGRSGNEVNARIRSIPNFAKIIKESRYAGVDTDIKLENDAKKGVKAMYKFIGEYDGYKTEVIIRDKGNKQFLYEIKFINEKSSQQSMTAKHTASPAPKGDVENNVNIAQKSEEINTFDKKIDDERKSISKSVDSEGNSLSAEQAEYFKDSKVRDENGNLLVVYHGSEAVFNEFKHRYINTHGSQEGRGFYFTDSVNMASGYEKDGGQLLKGYVNISKPLSDTELTLTRKEVASLIKAIDPTGDDLIANYDTGGGMGYPSRAWYNRAFNDTLDAVMNYCDTDSEVLAELRNAGADEEKLLKTVRRTLGYDGYITSEKYENAQIFVAFESNQFKNVDNTAPTDNPDIRYSKSKNSFSEQVDDVLDGKDTSSTHLYVMDTPSLLQEAGLPSLPILLTAKHLKNIIAENGSGSANYHGLDKEIVKKLPEYIADPVMMADSFTRNDSVVIVTEAIDSQNRPVIAAIMLNGNGRLEKKHIDANIITSAYGKDGFQNFLNKIAENNATFYWNNKKSQEMSVSLGIQFPNAITKLDSNTIIRKAKAFVNKNSEKISNERYSKSKFSTARWLDMTKSEEMLKALEDIDETLSNEEAVERLKKIGFSSIDTDNVWDELTKIRAEIREYATSERAAYRESNKKDTSSVAKATPSPQGEGYKGAEDEENFRNLVENDPEEIKYRAAEKERKESEGALLRQEKLEAYKKLGVLEDDIKMLENMEELAKMESILTVDPAKLEKTGKSPYELYTEWFNILGNNIKSDRFGNITLSNSTVRSEIRHGTTAAKLATIEAIPDVIEKGEIIFDREKQGGVKRFVVCAPIKIGEQDYYMGVMLQKDAQHQRLYLHNVVSMKIKREALASEKADLVTTGAQTKDDLSMTIILQNALKVKFSDKKITTEFDEESFDNEERQRMAEEEQKEYWEYYDEKHNSYVGRGKVREFILEAIDSSGILENLGEDVAFVGKDAQKKILSVLFRRVNASDEYNKRSFANYVAKKIIENVVLGEGKVFKAEARLRSIMHKIDISSVEEKISKRDKLKFTSRWKSREVEPSISISDAAKELNDLGYQIPMTDELQMLEEINKVYENTREYIENEMGDYLAKRMGKKEYASTKKKLADEIFAFLEENQTENELAGKLAFMVNKHQRALEKYREYRKEFKVDENRVHAEMAIVHLVRQIKTDIKNHTYTPAQQPRFNEFKGIIAKIAKLEVRGNINRSSAKDIIADLTLWYTKENELLVDAFNEDIREDITYFRDSESKEKVLSIDELYRLSRILAHLKNVFVNFGKIYRAGKWVELSEVAVPMYENSLEAIKSDTGFSSLMRRAQYFESPLAVAAILDGHVRGEFTRYVEDLQRGQLNVSVEKMKIAEKIEEFFKKDRKLFNSLVSGKLKVKCGIKVDLRSETMIADIEIPAVNLVNLYLCTRTMSPEDFTLEKVGYAVKMDNSGKYQYMAPTSREEIEKAYNTLPEPVKELAMWIQKWNNTEGKKMKYEQDIRLNGVSNVISGDYWHLKRLHFEGTNDMEKLFGSRGIGNHGFNKERIKQASSMLVVDNFIEAFLNHTEELFQYKYIDITIKNFNKIVQANVNTDPDGANKNEGFRSVKMLIEEQGFYHGTIAKDKTALDYMTQLGKDVLKVDKNSDPFNVIIGNMRAGYASFMLGANVKVWATQFSSLIAGFGELRADSVLYGAANILRIFNPKSIAKLAQEVDEYCDWARVRHFEKGATKAMTLTDKIGKWRGIFTKPIELFDRFIVMLEYLACKFEAQKRFGLKIGTKENKMKAGELLTEVGLKTQQNQYESTKSAAIRSQNEIMKGLVMFRTDSHMVLSGLIKELSALSVLNKKIKLAEKDGDLAKVAELKKMRNQAGKKTAKYATVVMLSCAYMTLLARLFNRFYEQDEDDEMTVGDICLDLFGNFLGMFPILSEIGSFLIDGYDVDNSVYSSVNNALGAVDKTIDLFKKAISGKKITSEEAASTLRNDIYAIGQIFGVPAKNLYKNTKWVIGWFAPNAEDKMDAWFKAPSEKGTVENIKAAIDKGDARAQKTQLDLLYSKYDLELKDAVLRGEYDRLMTLEVTKGEDDKVKYTPLEAKIPSNLEINGEDVELTRKDVNAFKNALISCENSQARVVKTANYKRLGNEERAYALRKINQYYFESTKYTYTGEKSSFAYYAKVVGVEQLALIMAYAKNLKGDEADGRFKKAQTRREKIEAYIKALGLNSVKTSLALRALGYGDKENDALVTSYVSRASALTKEERAEMLEILK